MRLDDLRTAEYMDWKGVCAQLKQAGAVTIIDLESGNPDITEGQRLLTSIRQWGESLVLLRQAKSEALAR